METIQQEHSQLTILKSQDISKIIKHFSFTIQQRFQQIEKNYNNYFTCLNNNTSVYDKAEVQTYILSKYSEYKTSNQQEIKLLEKFVQRITQVFQFFRMKSQQAEMLQHMSEKIQDKLKQILKNEVNYHFFVNNRPKTHKSNARPLQGNNNVLNSSTSQNQQGNSFSINNSNLSTIHNYSNQQSFANISSNIIAKSQFDVNCVFISNKKTKTETPQKRTIDVGKLFKYVFSVLKKGYLMKLKMQKNDYKDRKNKNIKNQSLNTKNNCQNTTIAIQGTGAILRNYSQKIKQQNTQNSANSLLQSDLFQNKNNKKQFYLYKKIKNRSSSTNTTTQYSLLLNTSTQCPSTLIKNNQNFIPTINSTKTIRDTQKQINSLYGIMDIQKYYVLKIAKTKMKDYDIWKKDQCKRNQCIQKERKKFLSEWNRMDKEKTQQNNQELIKTQQNFYEQNNSTEIIKMQEQLIPQSANHIRIQQQQDNCQVQELDQYQNSSSSIYKNKKPSKPLIQIIAQQQQQSTVQHQIQEVQPFTIQIVKSQISFPHNKKHYNASSSTVRQKKQITGDLNQEQQQKIRMKLKTEQNYVKNIHEGHQNQNMQDVQTNANILLNSNNNNKKYLNKENLYNVRGFNKQSNSQTLVVSSSRTNKQKENKVLTDKTSNLMDRNNLYDESKHCYKSKSVKQSKKQFRLNLPKVFGQQSQSNRTTQNISEKVRQIKQNQKQQVLLILSQKNQQNNKKHYRNLQQKISQKSQKYLLDSYYNDTYDNDNLFVPLLPKKQDQNYYRDSKYSQNISNKRKKAALSNLHPLNRCRVFRQNQKNLLGPKNSSNFKSKELLEDGLCFGSYEKVKKIVL